MKRKNTLKNSKIKILKTVYNDLNKHYKFYVKEAISKSHIPEREYGKLNGISLSLLVIAMRMSKVEKS